MNKPPPPVDDSPVTLAAKDDAYLRALARRRPVDERTHRDELLFVVTHHATELWLDVVAEDLDMMNSLISRQQLPEAVHLMQRDTLIIRHITESLSILSRLSPWDYILIKRGLRAMKGTTGIGSGGDSPAFRVVRSRARELRATWNGLLTARGVSAVDIYQRRAEFGDLYALAEALLEWDESLMLWRARHFRLVNRIIGGKGVGTAGMSVTELGALLNKEQFPELWEVRNELTRRAES